MGTWQSFSNVGPLLYPPCGRYHTQSHSLSLEMVTVFHPPVYLCRGQTNSSLSTSPLHLSSALFPSTFPLHLFSTFPQHFSSALVAFGVSTFPQHFLGTFPLLSLSICCTLCQHFSSAFVVLCASTFAQHLLHFVSALLLGICCTLCQHFCSAFVALCASTFPQHLSHFVSALFLCIYCTSWHCSSCTTSSHLVPFPFPPSRRLPCRILLSATQIPTLAASAVSLATAGARAARVA